ncbi:hypothetical protein E2C01_093422 [Portunus trituberculatus]|uniref:Uncharacterized protein n=1 Tax=Portunus trituberculatus TaxID=210409 RepID=A0A5B7JPS2_PORTR|nr:hypothetical protein [Portunus trituberculatus]
MTQDTRDTRHRPAGGTTRTYRGTPSLATIRAGKCVVMTQGGYREEVEAWMDVTSLATALRFVGVFTVGCARLGLGVVTVEVTPTTSRASAVGLCAAQAAIGEILASFMTVMVSEYT